MLHGDAIREIMLEGPGAGGLETASAVVADMVSVLGTTGTGFLQDDACWRSLPTLPSGDLPAPFYVRIAVETGRGAAHIAEQFEEGVSIAQLAAGAERRRGARRRHHTAPSVGLPPPRPDRSSSRGARRLGAGSSPNARCLR
jgi:hypothetical protein